VSGARDEVLPPLEALLELAVERVRKAVERVRKVVVAGRLGARSGAEVIVKVGGGVQMSGVGVVMMVRMKGVTLVGVAGVGMAEGMVGMEAGAGAGVAEEVRAGAGVAGMAVGVGAGVVAGEGEVGEVGVAVSVAGVAVGEGVAVAVAVAGVGVGVRESVLVVRSHWDTPLAGPRSCIQPGAGFLRRVEGRLPSSKIC
jgi:hypothetical protein